MFYLISNEILLCFDIAMYDLSNILHRNVIQVSVSGLDKHFDLCLDVCNHASEFFFFFLALQVYVNKHAYLRISVQVFALYNQPNEISEVFVSLLCPVELFVNTISLLFE